MSNGNGHGDQNGLGNQNGQGQNQGGEGEHNHVRYLTLHSHAHVALGSSGAVVHLQGNHITLTGTSGNVTVTGQHTNHDTIALGNGTDVVALSGNHDDVTLGNGNDAVALGAHSQHDTVKVRNGTDTITTAAGDQHNTFLLDASTSSLVLRTGNVVFVNGGDDTITDSPAGADKLTLHVGSSGGVIDIANFSAAHGVVDLTPNLGFSSGSDAAASLRHDGHGGSLLRLGHHGSLGSIDFQGVPLGLLHASNFTVT